MSIFRGILAVAGACALGLFSISAMAEPFSYRITSVWTGQPLDIGGAAQDGGWIADYGDDGTFLLSVNGQSVMLSGGQLALGAAGDGSGAARWQLEPSDGNSARIRSVDQPDVYIHIESGAPQAGPVEPSWLSARWQVFDRGDDAGGQSYGALPVGGNAGYSALPSAGLPPVANLPRQPTIAAAPRPSAGGLRPVAAAPAVATMISLIIQNRSGAPLDVFADDRNGEQVYLATLEPNQQMQQDTPPGVVWRLAQNDQWLDAYRIDDTAAEQVIVFPADAGGGQ